jgi:plastocyanin
VLGLAAVAILILSVGAAYAIAAQPQYQQYQQNGSSVGMMGGRGSGGGMMGGQTASSGSMMRSQGGMMGSFGNIMSGYASMMGSMQSAMDRFGGMMSRMVQQMGGIWSQARNVSESGNFVAISGYAYYPSSITISKGTTVTWVNMDFVQHTVTSGTEQAPTGDFDSHLLGHMQSFSYTFNTPGTYAYYCDLHPNMIGTVQVTG